MIFAFAIGLAAVPARALQPSPADDCRQLFTTQPHVIPEDLAKFQTVATARHLEIVIMAPNPASMRYRSRPGFAAKTAELKRCRSAVSGDIEGLVACPESAFASRADWVKNRDELRALGYEILGPDRGYLVRRIEDGKYFFSDYDLFSVRDVAKNAPAYSEDFRAEINTLLGRRLVRHGPLEDYELRTGVPIKLPLIIVRDQATPVVIETRADLEREFNARDLPLW